MGIKNKYIITMIIHRLRFLEFNYPENTSIYSLKLCNKYKKRMFELFAENINLFTNIELTILIEHYPDLILYMKKSSQQLKMIAILESMYHADKNKIFELFNTLKPQLSSTTQLKIILGLYLNNVCVGIYNVPHSNSVAKKIVNSNMVSKNVINKLLDLKPTAITLIECPTRRQIYRSYNNGYNEAIFMIKNPTGIDLNEQTLARLKQ